ncbi:hypothetical protein E2562_029313 [Oryza meyeriana var. granulata]|uniref:Uncharacterized protein n=1 Tax=Oryza meyeriana var. granulata TaxID=110450 RepID=A0A6G1E481_9ORYZ|nr:hypothetical protein E2562_029313 [Oryza meyeriana var. granulata]
MSSPPDWARNEVQQWWIQDGPTRLGSRELLTRTGPSTAYMEIGPAGNGGQLDEEGTPPWQETSKTASPAIPPKAYWYF